MSKNNPLRNLFKLYFSETYNNYLPNQNKIRETMDSFYSFIEKAKDNSKLLGEDDAHLNCYLSQYMDEYAFSAFCVGLTLGKDIETEFETIEKIINT